MEYKTHEFADLFPLMQPHEFVDLKADIRQRGLLNPIIVLDGRILDGRNRFKACQEVGVNPFVVEYSGNDALGDVISWNLKRRHLDETQRAYVAAKLANIKRGDFCGNQHEASANLQTPQVSQSQAAEMLNVSPRSVATAKKIQESASPEIIELSESGKMSLNSASIASSFEDEVQIEIAEEIKSGAKPAEVIKKHVHVAQNSGENEWYTPSAFIEAARKVLGNIDLDPASCEIANQTVLAEKFYTKEDDGLSKSWHGNVWINPPYAQPLISQFSEKLVSEIENIDQAIVLVNNATETKWFSRMARAADAICFPESRIRFLDPQGNPGAPLQGQAFIYFGRRKEIFLTHFNEFGFVMGAID